jgi:serine/threonine protein kinase
MLQKNPFARITASQALEHPFFYDVKQDSKSMVLE